MSDIEKLRAVIKDSGMTMTAVANKSGINRVTLYNRLLGVGEFTASEIMGLTDALHLSPEDRDAIFFATEVEKSKLT